MTRKKRIPVYLEGARCLCGHSGKADLRWEPRPGLVMDIRDCPYHQTFDTWTEVMRKQLLTRVVYVLMGESE